MNGRNHKDRVPAKLSLLSVETCHLLSDQAIPGLLQTMVLRFSLWQNGLWFSIQILTCAHSRARQVPSLTSPGSGLPPTTTIPVRSSKTSSTRRVSNPDFCNRDVRSHHTESNALPTELSGRTLTLGFRLVTLTDVRHLGRTLAETLSKLRRAIGARSVEVG